MTAPTTDRDGKSKTASAADAQHYPEQNEVATDDLFPSPDEIAQRAHELWLLRGRPDGSADLDWLQAEQELKAANPHKPSSQALRQGSGSVQN